MTRLAASLALGLLWVALTGTPSAAGLIAGTVIGYLILRLTGSRLRVARPRRLPVVVGFLAFFVKELVLSTLRVAVQLFRSRRSMTPGIVAVPLDATTDAEITFLACLVSLTPGTLTIEISPDRDTIFVHTMFARDAAAERVRIKRELEGRILRLTR